MSLDVRHASSAWDVLRDELRRATSEQRRPLWGALATFGLAIVLAIIDTATGSPGQEKYRLIAIIIAAFGLLCRVTAAVVLGVGAASDSGWRTGVDRPAALNRAMLAAPTLNAIAVISLALAAGMFVLAADARVGLAIATPVLLVLAALAARDMIGATRALYAQAIDRDRAAERAEAAATAARLAALQAQTNPHFLFNALNTVASLVRTDTRRAEAAVENLADVLRRTLDRSRRPLSSVRDEVEYVRAYLAIEEERWGDALRVTWEVDPGALDLAMPTMGLQPLVENALKHGVGGRLDGGRIGIAITRDGPVLTVGVIDDGPGFPTVAARGNGLTNLERRLEALYGEDAELRVESSDGDTTVCIRLPAHAPSGESRLAHAGSDR